MIHGMGRLQGGHNAFGLTQQAQSLNSVSVVHRYIGSSATVLQEAMLRTDTRVIKTSRDTVRGQHLAIFILQQIAACAVQDAGGACYQGGGVLPSAYAVSCSLHA